MNGKCIISQQMIYYNILQPIPKGFGMFIYYLQVEMEREINLLFAA